ncbi:MAG TPA: flagellar filament capping protein FliD [Rhodanobacteraceae bacterium]
MSLTLTTLSQSQVQSLLTAETTQLEQPIVNWQAQIKTDQAMISSWGTIGGALTTLQNDIGPLKDPTQFNDRAATSSDSSVATATATNTAAAGTYQLTNVQPAAAQSVYSASYASPSASLGSGSGSLTITLASGTTETVNVGAADATLSGVVAAINAASNGQVTASIVGGSSGDRLVIAGNTTGASSAFTISGSGSLSGFTYSTGGTGNTFTLATAASDASMDVNGVPVSNATNTFADAIPGATITVAGTGSSTVQVTASASAMSSAASTVVGDYNAAVAAIQKATAFNGANSQTPNGPLLGNFSAADIATQLGSAVSTLSFGGLSANAAGISLNKDGSLTFNASNFAAAYASNPTALSGLVSELYTQLNNVLQPAVGSTITGTVAEQTNALNQTVTGLNQEIAQETTSINAQIENDANAYGAMENAQATYGSWNDYLDAISSGSSNG